MDERGLVLRAQQGDARAFEALVRSHWELAFRLAFVITRIPADAEDAVQEAFVKAWRAFGRFRASEPLRPWLLQIVANEARNRQRSARRRERMLQRARAQLTLDAAEPSTEDLAQEADERRRLLAELEGMPEPARLVLSCRFLLGLSEAETAAVLGVPAGTVKSRAARGLERLRERHV